MGWYIYPQPPGTVLGPCATKCKHLDCAKSRHDAESECRFCGKPIGYGNRVYLEDNGLVHADCYERPAVIPAPLLEYPAQVLAVVRGNAALSAITTEIDRIEHLRRSVTTRDSSPMFIENPLIRDVAAEGLTERSKSKRLALADSFYALYLTALEAERIAGDQ